MPPRAPATNGPPLPPRFRRPRPFAGFRGLLLALTLAAAWPGPATATIDRIVRWTASPLKSPTGQPLPPAVSYEVWLVVDAKPESLAAAVPDTFWTLQARPGTVYRVRVRGVSAQGHKSAFSTWSDPWRAAASPADAPAGEAHLHGAHPNPFHAHTALAYTIASDLPAGAVPGLEIFDLRGCRVRTLPVDRGSGGHEARWDGTDAGGRPVPAGVYLARFVCGAYRATARLTLVP